MLISHCITVQKFRNSIIRLYVLYKYTFCMHVTNYTKA